MPKTLPPSDHLLDTNEREKAVRPFKLHTVKGQLVDPNRSLDRISELIVFDDEAAYLNS